MVSNRIAFGSCNNQNLTNPLWDVIAQRNPDAFIWAGDAIYADINIGHDWSYFPPRSMHQSATPDSLRQNYKKQKSNPSYQHFLSQINATVFGTIDDHDYGMNNGDRRFKFKKESATAFLDFVGEEKDGLMYERAKNGHGVYGVKVFDFSKEKGQYLLSDEEAGLDSDLSLTDDQSYQNSETIITRDRQYEPRRVAVFVLDVRTNRTPWSDGFKAWTPNYDGDFLGDRQWEWFESSIRKSNASVNLIINGLQVHSYRHPNANFAEVWSHFPRSRQRLYDAILQDGILAPIIVSGDVHMAQLLRKDCIRTSDAKQEDVKFRPLVEITSSGMTHSWGSCFASSETLHNTWKYYPCHFFSYSMMTLAHLIFPMPDLMVSNNNNKVEDGFNLYENGGAENAKEGKQYAIGLNFGEFEFDWTAREVKIRAMGEDDTAPPLLSASYSFDQLSGDKPMPGSYANFESSEKRGRYLMDGKLVTNGDYICMNHRSAPNLFQIVLGFMGMTTFVAVVILGPQILLLLLIKKRFRK